MLDEATQPLVALPDVLRAIGVPASMRYLVIRKVNKAEIRLISSAVGPVKVVPAHIALAVIKVIVPVAAGYPFVDEFIRIAADATADWVRAIAVGISRRLMWIRRQQITGSGRQPKRHTS